MRRGGIIGLGNVAIHGHLPGWLDRPDVLIAAAADARPGQRAECQRLLPEARIAFFLHIPFPSSEVFRILPRKNRILDGLLGSNLVGVHTYDYARHLVTRRQR